MFDDFRSSVPPASGGTLPSGGEYRYRKDGEEHLWTPQRIVDLREAVRNNDYARFRRYTDDIDANLLVVQDYSLPFPLIF